MGAREGVFLPPNALMSDLVSFLSGGYKHS